MGAPTRRWLAGIPHALSALRVLLVVVTYEPAMRQDAAAFGLLVLLAVLTDILDGPIARHFGTANRFGANMDSASDLMFYLSLPVWAYMFRPAVVLQQLPVIILLTLLYVAANLLSHRTFGALGVHNRLSRASGTFGVLVAFYTILWGLNPLLYVLLVALMSADLAQRYGKLARAKWGPPRQPQGA